VSTHRPLAAKRILITRARHQAGRLAEALEEQGAEVLRLPTIEIVPPETYAHLDAVLEVISGFDWLIVTSANGAAALADRMQFLRIRSEHLKHLQVAAIGPATAVAVGRIGLTVSAMPDEYVAEAVVAMLREKVAGRRVLLARAAVARDIIPEQLRKCGADIHVVEAYRTVIPADSIEQVRALFGEGEPLPDAVTFTSSSTVNNFFALLAAAGIELPPGLKAISIGPVTSRTLRQHHWEPVREAAKYDIPGLVAACVKVLGVKALG
jgi:uroporphyrinogen-III synthase